MEKRNIRCTWENILYLAQGFVLAAIGVTGVIMFKCFDEECVHVRGIFMVLLLLACFQLISSGIYIKCYFKFKMSTIFTVYFLWGCMIGCLATYQAVLYYEYKQAFTLHVFTNILTGLLVLLVILINIIHVVKICRNEEMDEWPEKVMEVGLTFITLRDTDVQLL